MWITIYSNRRSKPDPVRDANYKAFMRADYNKWSYFLAIFTHILFIPRFIIAWSIFLSCSIFVVTVCIGEDTNNLPVWKANFIRNVSNKVMIVVSLIGGIWTRRERLKVDYSKYLGKDSA